MTSEEGYIKFRLTWTETGPVIPAEVYVKISAWRDILYKLGMVGASEQGIGFGNLSIRSRNPRYFYITGSATGSFRNLEENHFSLVTDYNLDNNMLCCSGPVKASSESMSHAAIYNSIPDINAVIHIHHHRFWESLMNRVPTTPAAVKYGTPEMAREIIMLLKEPETLTKRIIVMGGHEDGIIFFGHNMDEAGAYCLSYYNQVI